MPKLSRKRKKAFLFDEDSAASRAIRNLVSSLILEREGSEVVLITSSVHNEGKTTVSLNMAAQFAESGEQTLLIDGALDSPDLTDVLDLGGTPGFSELVLGEQALSTGITVLGVCNGSTPGNCNRHIVGQQLLRHFDMSFVVPRFGIITSHHSHNTTESPRHNRVV